MLLSCSSLSAAAAGKVPAGFTEHFVEVNGARLHYFIGGKGSPVVLLHGYAETSHFAELRKTPLPMPLLVLTGEKASGNFLIEQARLVASNVSGQVVLGSGHWLMEEAPEQVIPKLVEFLNR